MLAILLVASFATAGAQRFYNLTADEVRIDSVLPQFGCSIPLGEHYADSVYTVCILYPEFYDMTPTDIRRYQNITSAPLPEMPEPETTIVVERKRGAMEVRFVPLVYRDGKYQILVSFMLAVEARPVQAAMRKAPLASSQRYADNSVLASGRWAKIRVPSSGIYQLTDALVRQAGFTDLSKVKVYGYGGALQNEKLVPAELIATDDLKEVPTCTVNGRRLFYAQGPVSWSQHTSMKRIRNPYSDYGYYFLTQGDDAPASLDSAAFVASCYPMPADYHSLHEVDNFAWLHGGRKLFENIPIAAGQSHAFTLANPSGDRKGSMAVVVTAGNATRVQVSLNDSILGTLSVTLRSYDKGYEASGTYDVYNLSSTDTVTITTLSGGPARLDYIDIHTDSPHALPRLSSASLPVPEYVYGITNQNLHAHGPADLVIIIPTSQKLLGQAQRIAKMHEERDSMRVRIVPADEIYNEYSSGTPDANAYRRYMKMLYDRATGEADMPKHLLLFGDGKWDNRLLTSDCRGFSADDLLLCYESEDSYNEVNCIVDDGFYGLLDDGEGINPMSSDKLDLSIGRFPVSTVDDAKTLTDKTINYVENANAGSWQNIVAVLGDDGNSNSHMNDANNIANVVTTNYPGYQTKKVMWDAYTRVTTSTGNTYPDATKEIKQLQASGALIIDYSGHGSEINISHERVLILKDFQQFSNTNLPLWVTASCDISPFDGVDDNIGVAMLLNKKGGAVATFTTTRTVYQGYNASLNKAYIRYVLDNTGDRPVTIGEAQRLAKNLMITGGEDVTANKLRFSLLGDPAMSLNVPMLRTVVDSINGKPLTDTGDITIRAGEIVSVKGHVEQGGEPATTFNGIVTCIVRDSEKLVVCKGQADDARTLFKYYDRPNVLFNGSDSVRGGTFTFTFAVPMDINYSNGSGMMNFYAVDNSHTRIAHGSTDRFLIGGTQVIDNDSIGPSVFCYLNTPSFSNGDEVNSTPYFVAQITDKDGINSAGTGIGHDLELVIDNDMSRTYLLNDNFSYDFGSYTSGRTSYSIPALPPGRHTLRFRAWDMLNNSTTAELSFNVVSGLKPTLYSIGCTDNPARTSTTFIINHDRMGSTMDVELDIFDMSGRQLWKFTETEVSATGAMTIEWNLTTGSGQRLQTGVYLYRVRVSCDGSDMVSKAKKLIVIGNN